MTKILSAYLSRLWKDKFFWLAMLFMAGFGVFLTLNQYNNQQLLQQRGLVETTDLALEQYCFFFQWVIGGVAALVSSLFLGLEYQDGTLRNKLIAGHSRTSVYLAGLIINLVSALALCFCYSFFFLRHRRSLDGRISSGNRNAALAAGGQLIGGSGILFPLYSD